VQHESKRLPDYICTPGLPDVIFSNKKSQFGYISEDLGMENVGIFYGRS
jgi:hypothetical protein